MPSRIYITCWLVFGALVGQAQDNDPTETLRKIRERVADNIRQLPNYLCTETVDRQYLEIDPLLPRDSAYPCENLATKSPDSFKLRSSDRLRLDVALTSTGEIYSWVGEDRFDDRSLSEIVTHGTTSTGAFGLFLHEIFVSDNASFEFKSRSEENGRPVLNYAFEVPLARSGYTVSMHMLTRLTAYAGAFTADAQTFELLRMELHADRLAPELQVCRTQSSSDYARVPINGTTILLPSEVKVHMLESDGSESYNRTLFSGCHQFLGESKLIFDEKPADQSGASSEARKTKMTKIPAGLAMLVALDNAIDPATAAAGDPISGRLTHAVKVSDSGLIIPKGAKLNGRILGLSRIYAPEMELQFGLKWESINLNGENLPLQLKQRMVSAATTRSKRDPLPDVDSMTRPEQPGVTFFRFQRVGKDYRVPAGFEVEWVTVRP